MQKTRATAAVLLILGLFFSFKSQDWVNRLGRPTVFSYDVNQYYSYLPAAFIQGDLSFAYEHNYWTQKTARGTQVPKVTMGMAMLYAPWFAIAHTGVLRVKPKNEITGYEAAYDRWLHRGTLVYALLAAFIMLQVLFHFFKPWIAAATYLAVFFGSNLFYYTVSQGENVHSYLFFLLSLMLWATVKVHQKPKIIWLVLLGISYGWAALIRPTLLITALFPLLYQVYDIVSLQAKGQFLKSLGWRWLVLIAAVALPILPQLLYWHALTGQWLFYSYGSNEGFFWQDPKIVQVLFSFRAGWMVYTPLALFMVGGMAGLGAQWKTLRWAVLPLLLTSIYVIASWWDWWYGGAFGHRAFVHYYPFWLFPLGAAFQWLGRHPVWRYLTLALVGIFIYLNLFQSIQYRHNIIHYDGMTREAYWYGFGKKHLTAQGYEELRQRINRPDYEAAQKGKRNP